MSRGLGAVQLGCLASIAKHEGAFNPKAERSIGDWPTTFTIAYDVYAVKSDRHGDRMCSEAQHVAVKRALSGLQRMGKIIGVRNTNYIDPGTGHAMRGSIWMTRAGLLHYLRWQNEEASRFTEEETVAVAERARAMDGKSRSSHRTGARKCLRCVSRAMRKTMPTPRLSAG